MTYRRNNTLEILKLFASYMVVFIHVLFYGRIGVAVDALARFAVPFFFLVSGFYSYRITLDRIKSRIVHLLFLLAFAVLLYTVYDVSKLLIKQDFQGVVRYFNQCFDFKNMLKLVLFNKPVYAGHLWYLFAILYVYLIRYFAVLFKIYDKLFWTISLLALCLHLLMGEFLSSFGIVLPIYIVRNFALLGIPFFGLGMLANKYRHKLIDIPNLVIIISIIIGVLETLFSRYFFGKNEIYLGSVFILFAIVLVFLKFSNVKYPSMLTSLEGCNTYIYILHPMVSSVMVNMYALLTVDFGGGGYLVLRMTHPLIVCLVSTALAYVSNKILKRVEKRIKYGRAG